MRLAPLTHWFDNPERYFARGEQALVPLLFNTDGYHYLTLGRDWAAGEYGNRDSRLFVPQGVPRPAPLPLLSLLTESLSRLLAVPREWVALLAPCLLGVLICIPVFLLGRAYGGDLAGFASALAVVVAPYYLLRSSLGWFDTDMSNVTLALTLAYAIMGVGQAASPRARWRYLVLLLLATLFFLWWWGGAVVVVTGLLGVPLVLTLLLQRGISASARSTLAFSLLTAMVAVLIAYWFEPRYLNAVYALFALILQVPDGVYAQSAGAIAELQAFSPRVLGDKMAGDWYAVVPAGVGLCWLLWDKKSQTIPLAGVALVGALALFAVRFLIFVTPLYALGIGYLVAKIVAMLRPRLGDRAGVAGFGLLIVLLWSPVHAAWQEWDRVPRWHPHHVETMRKLERTTEPDAIVWSSWGHGYPLRHYAQRGTIGDGGHNDGRTIYLTNFPMASADERLAANWVRFYVVRGVRGLQRVARTLEQGDAAGIAFLQRILAAGPDKAKAILLDAGYGDGRSVDRTLEFFFPSRSPPIYVLVTDLWAAYRWYSGGAWDFSSRQSPNQLYRVYDNLTSDPRQTRLSGTLLVDPKERIEVDIRDGAFRIMREGDEVARNRLGSVSGLGERVALKRDFANASPLELEISGFDGFGVLLDGHTRRTVMHRLYGKRRPETGYFTLVDDDAPRAVVWRVRGDRYRLQ